MNGVSVADNGGRGVNCDGNWWVGEDISVIASIFFIVICLGILDATVGRWWDQVEIGKDFVRLVEQAVGR